MILLFVGAGGAAAVDEKQFPTTVDFLQEFLSKEIQASRWFQLTYQFCQESYGSDKSPAEKTPVDIEQVLWEMQDMKDHLSQMEDYTKIMGWMWRDDTRMKEASGYSGAYKSPANIATHARASLEGVRNSIWRKVHEVYGVESDENSYRTNLWALFLKRLLSRESLPIEIFTTNYDKIFEGTIIQNGLPIETGRKDRTGRTILDVSRWGTSLDSDKRGRLTKLHGSTDWRYVENQIQCSDYLGSGFDPDDKAILYPGIKGRSPKFIPPPFDRFYEHLEEIASKADALIFVGYSFRDVQINGILQESISNNIVDRRAKGNPVAIVDINPEKSPEVPEVIRRHARCIRGKLSRAKINECIRYLEMQKVIKRHGRKQQESSSLELIRHAWVRIIDRLKQEQPSVAPSLAEAQLDSLGDSTLKLLFSPEAGFQKRLVEKNRDAVERAISEEIGKPISIVCETKQD